MLADQRQRCRDHLGRVVGDDFEVRQIVSRRQVVCRYDHGKVAEAGILRQHGEEGVDHARAKAFAEHDAVDVSDVEMLRRRLDRERADHAGALAKRDRQRRIGAAAADQQHGGVARRIDMRRRHRRCRYQPAHHGRMQRPHAQRRTQAGHQTVGAALSLQDLALKEGNDVVRMRYLRVDRDQRQIRLACRNPRCQLRQSGFMGVGGCRQHGGRLHLFDCAHRVRPLGLDHRKQPADIERGGKRRPSRSRHDEDRTLLGHVENSDQARIWSQRS